MANRLSIIICTYNREKYLEYALESLILQTAEQDSFEILIIDNNSSDNTKEVFKRFKDKLPLRYFLEKKQGLSHARNRGINESKYNYIAFLDDDAKASKNWIRLGLEIIQRNKADIFGGPIHPYYESKKPKWFKDEYEIREHGQDPKYLEKEYLSGSNIFFKKDIFKKIGFFDPNYGMKGSKIFLGEESKLQMVAERKGVKRFYHPNLIVYHLVPANKMEMPYLMKRCIANKVTQGKLVKEEMGIRAMLIPLIAVLRTLGGLLKLLFIFFRNRGEHPHWQNYFIERVMNDIFYIGKIRGLFL